MRSAQVVAKARLNLIEDQNNPIVVTELAKQLRISRIEFKSGSKAIRRIFEEVKALTSAGPSPRLILNDHCQICEFRQRCHSLALKEDNLSLLRGIGDKEVKAYARKGIFTITQLSHTFRPRRKGKRGDRRSNKRYHCRCRVRPVGTAARR